MDGGAPSADQGRAASARARLVAAAVELVLEHHSEEPDLRQVYSYFTPGAVASRSGLSRALIYHHWGATPGGDAFTAFLSDVTREIWSRAADPERLMGELPAEVGNLSAIVLELSATELDHERGANRSLLRASTSLALAGVIDDSGSADVVDRLSRTYRSMGELLGYEPVPPLSYDDLATSITCVFLGFALIADAVPDRVARRHTWTPLEPVGDDADGWPMLAIVLESLLAAMVRPADGASAP